MRVVGKRRQYDISLSPSAEKLVAGARWNDAMAASFGNADVGVFPKGVYRYASHEAADTACQEAIARRMARIARIRRDG